MNLPPEKAREIALEMAKTCVLASVQLDRLKRECWNRGIDIADADQPRMERELTAAMTDEFLGLPRRRPREPIQFECPGEIPEKHNPYPLCDNKTCPYCDYCNRSAHMDDAQKEG